MPRKKSDISETPVNTVTERASGNEGYSGARLTVACKLPHGLRLRLYNMVEKQETIPNGYRTVKEAEQVGDEIVLNGNAVEVIKRPGWDIVGGYGLTRNVPKDFFEAWLKQNHDSPIVRNNLIFAYESDDKAEDAAQDHESVRSGFEPISQDGDPRMPKSINAADRKAA